MNRPLLHISLLLASLSFFLPRARAQQPVQITVDAASHGTLWRPTWNWFGADEPNYITTPAGRALLHQLAGLDPGTPVYFRPHNLLTSGNGTPSLKWGSTGVYTEDAQGRPVYHWRITDQLFDTLVHSGITPFVEIGFTPEALSPHPQPYRHSFPKGSIFTGWSYPPDNDAKWSALITAWADHLRARYGPQVEKWRWEVWNEPDIAYFHGTPAQYFHLYDVTAAALRKAILGALVGGPAVTGPYGKNDFLERFLEHCAHGTNAATGKRGAPLTFISFHPKGAPKVLNGQAQMGIYQQLEAMRNGFRTVAGFPAFAHLPVVMSESDPEGCAACLSAANRYRNTEAYGSAILEATARSLELARLYHVDLIGAVNWSFVFPGQPTFAGFRSMATALPDPAHPILDKPVLNTLRLLGELGGERLPVTLAYITAHAYAPRQNAPALGETAEAAGPVASLDELLQRGVRQDVGALATRRPHELDVLLWTYSDALTAAPPTAITLSLRNLPRTGLTFTRQLVDRDHSNAYTAWQKMGSPAHPSSVQVRSLLAAAKLQTVEHAPLLGTASPTRTLEISLERNAATLLRITWR